MMRFVILLWLLFPLQVTAQSAVWKISKDQAELYIGGTIHVLSRQDYPLPQEFDQAYRKADIVVLETDLVAMAQPQTQRHMLSRMMYRDGRSLRDELAPSTYRKLVEYVAKTALSLDVLTQFKPAMAALTLTMAELQRLDMADAGVDNYFNNLALRDGKRLEGLETVEQQIDLIANMGKGHEDAMILSTLDELRQLPELINGMKQAWRSGDMRTLEKLAIDPMRLEFPALYQSLLVSRNNRWLPKIEALLATPEKEFVLVGALHLAAKEGVIEQLQRRGYRVEQLQ